MYAEYQNLIGDEEDLTTIQVVLLLNVFFSLQNLECYHHEIYNHMEVLTQIEVLSYPFEVENDSPQESHPYQIKQFFLHLF